MTICPTRSRNESEASVLSTHVAVSKPGVLVIRSSGIGVMSGSRGEGAGAGVERLHAWIRSASVAVLNGRRRGMRGIYEGARASRD